MIFNSEPMALESEKERNLYTKFFAGYYFNEFIEGYDERVLLINEYLSEKLSVKVNLRKPSISFDNHAYMLTTDSDRGEFADILLHDPVSKTMIAIEAKYLSDWSMEEDIDNNLKRINAIRKQCEYTIHFCLLVSSSKWEAVKKAQNIPGSNYTKLKKIKNEKIGELTWEDLTNFCDSVAVKKYMKRRLNLVNKPTRERHPHIQN